MTVPSGNQVLSSGVVIFSNVHTRVPGGVLDTLEGSQRGGIAKVPEAVDLQRLLAVLTPREEEVVLLRLASLKYREIADELGISPKTVSTLLTRALKKLERAAAGQPGDPRSVAKKDETTKTLQ